MNNGFDKQIQDLEGIQINDTSSSKSTFISKPCSDWIKEIANQPIPKKLFDSFWFEDEVCFLFADSNIGKPILAYQIADSISSGRPIKGFKLETEPQKIIYFDFEMSPRQLEIRVSEDGHYYPFHHNFIRAEMYFNTEMEDNDPTSQMLESIEKEIKNHGAKVVIIDNFIHLGNDLERSKSSVPIMRQLSRIKKKLSLSMLILAHTPKRNPIEPISSNDLAGSKTIFNAADSAFSIGKSKEGDLRYIKQIKVRNSVQEYGANNVPICKIDKLNYLLQFVYQFNGYEKDLINPSKFTDEEQALIDFKEENPNISLRQLGEKFGFNHPQKVSRLLAKAGLIEK